MEEINLTRRQFLQATGATALALSLSHLGVLGGNALATQKIFDEWDYSKWEDLHRKEWTWDKVTYGTHLVDCYPGNCLWRVYTKDGVVLREEQAAKYPVVDPSSPDFNPRGCQKGAFQGLPPAAARPGPDSPGTLPYAIVLHCGMAHRSAMVSATRHPGGK